ncbi:MAG: hypothetical protein GY716_15570 [bacterium]|nr:hypothetical protein [bacterium]
MRILVCLFLSLAVAPAFAGCSDLDADGICDTDDNCPVDVNPEQADSDGDGVGDVCDTCPLDPTNSCETCTCPPDADCFPCPDDWDCDDVSDDDDNCPCLYNPSQDDADGDSVGDLCDICTDTDGDGFGNPGFPVSTCLSDNCPFHFNPAQTDGDGDGYGDACDNCDNQPECSGTCEAENSCYHDGECDPGEACLLFGCHPSYCQCDTTAGMWACTEDCAGTCIPQSCQDPTGIDTDADGILDACDNCPLVFNPEQTDTDADGLGDACDPTSGVIRISVEPGNLLMWGTVDPYDAWNLYRGDLQVLRTTGSYTQAPGSTSRAMHQCGLINPWYPDAEDPQSGTVAIYLVTGIAGGIESTLGTQGDGSPRLNGFPCGGPSEEALCNTTGGFWDIDSCYHYWCGQFPDCDAIVPGCDCGTGRNFVQGAGCVDDPVCP